MDRPTMWFPHFFQLRYWKNPNWLNSMWLGFIWPILLFPEIFMLTWVAPFGNHPWWIAPFARSYVLVLTYVKYWLHGIAGYMHAENVTVQEMNARLLRVMMQQDDNE